MVSFGNFGTFVSRPSLNDLPSPPSPEAFSLGSQRKTDLTFPFSFPMRETLHNNTSTELATSGTLSPSSVRNHVTLSGMTASRSAATPPSPTYLKQTERNNDAGCFVHRRHSKPRLPRRTQNAHRRHADLIQRHPPDPPTKSRQRPHRVRSPTRHFLP